MSGGVIQQRDDGHVYINAATQEVLVSAMKFGSKFIVTHGGISTEPIPGLQAWRMRNILLGYTEDVLREGDAEFYGLPADIVARFPPPG